MKLLTTIGLLILQFALHAQPVQTSLSIPLGGNSWVKTPCKEKVSDSGWQNWENPDAVWFTYFKPQKTGDMQISIRLSVPQGQTEIGVTLNGITHQVAAAGAEDRWYDAGTWSIQAPDYLELKTQGLQKTGTVFADVKEIHVSGSAVDSNTVFVKNNQDNYFYWGRRGPSCHLNYDLSAADDEAEWFYSEITVPVGSDPVGSYFMADGFAEGYFGMQVNSSTERRIIFSVWSPYNTDDPKSIPADQRIQLLKKGPGVVAEDFGNEGSGGHSHLVYSWKAGQAYKFLLHGKPLDDSHTNYSAYFFDNESGNWLLIASFTRPKTHSYLKKFHSFLENFEPEMGNTTRKGFYHNQWVKPAQGDWIAITRMTVSVDQTGRKKYRTDFNGGVENGQFYLKNGGFFNETAVLGKTFQVNPEQKPTMDLAELDK